MPKDLEKVKSSNIKGVFYNKGQKALDVVFINEAHYRYKEVPEETYKGLLEAESAGKYFYAKIRGSFAYELINNKKK
jgi:hypothetical protein